METSATKTVGVLTNSHGRRHTSDPLVKDLSYQQKALRLRIYQSNTSEDRSNIRQARNALLRKINKRLRELAIKQADALADDITSTDDCRKMFRAAHALKVTGPTPTLAVHNADGQFMGTDQGKADTICKWFSQQFTDPDDDSLESFTGDPRPLTTPITDDEVSQAIKSLKNCRSPGPDGIPNELFKCAKDVVSSPIASIINSAFHRHVPIESVGQGTLIALPKPKNASGSPANYDQ